MSRQNIKAWLASGLADTVVHLPGPDNRQRFALLKVSASLRQGDRPSTFNRADLAMRVRYVGESLGPEMDLLAGVVSILGRNGRNRRTILAKHACGVAGVVNLLPGPDNGERRTLRELWFLLMDGDHATAFSLADQAMTRLLQANTHGPETFLLAGVISILAHARPLKQGGQ